MNKGVKNLIALIVAAALLMLVCLSGCGGNNNTYDDGSPDFAAYESDEIYDIERVNLIGTLGSKCATYKFTYLSDYYEIKGFISIPKSASKSQPCKCILFNRGGNSDIGLLEDSDTANMCALTNRVIIASQYRGAGGSGGKDQYGGDDLHDVIKLVDFCDNNFDFVNMDDFCAAGVSRGGMMTYMSARQDSRIKRIIVVSGVSDLFSSYEEREDMSVVLRNYIGCTPTDNPAEYEKRSAVCWADEIKVPVLLIHSKLDKQVAFSQAESIYEKLKDSTDCTFIRNDGEYHGAQSGDYDKIAEWLNK